MTLTRGRLSEIVKLSQECGLNAVVMEVKDVDGDTFFNPSKDGTIRLKDAVDECHAAGLKAIARFCVLKDKAAEQKYPGMRYGLNPGSDKRIAPWTDPCSAETVEYNLKLIKALKGTGIDELNLDYIRFPSGQERAHVDLPLPTKCRKITDLVRAVREVTKGIRLSLDVFGYVAWDENSARVGQRFEDLAPYVDAIYPMLYPDHFARGDLGFKEPSGHPYEVVRKGCEAAKRKEGAQSIDIVPWIQCFTLKNDVINYGPTELLAQIQGAIDAGSPGYLVWSPSCKYQDLFLALRGARGLKDYTSLAKRYIPAKWTSVKTTKGTGGEEGQAELGSSPKLPPSARPPPSPAPAPPPPPFSAPSLDEPSPVAKKGRDKSRVSTGTSPKGGIGQARGRKRGGKGKVRPELEETSDDSLDPVLYRYNR